MGKNIGVSDELTKHLLKDREKRRILKILEGRNLDVSLFAWEEMRIGLRRFTALFCQPKRYYFVFAKKGDQVIPRTFFPCWKESVLDKDSVGADVLETQLHQWVDSIERVHKRQRQLFVPVADGAPTRRSFARIAETLKIETDSGNS